MQKLKRYAGILLSVIMVITGTMSGLSCVAYADDDTTGPVLEDYSIEVTNTDPKTEAGADIKVTLTFDEDIVPGNYINSAFNILMNGTTLSNMGFGLKGVSSEEKNLVLDIKALETAAMPRIVTGSLDITLKANYHDDIKDAVGNEVSEWTDIHTYIQTGLKFTEGEHVDGAAPVGGDDSGTKESISFDLSNEDENLSSNAVIRGMSPIQILMSHNIDTIDSNPMLAEKPVSNQCDLERSTVNVHTHMYIEGTNSTWAAALANNFYSQNYTMTASDTAVTISAKEASDTQTLTDVVVRAFGYAGPNDSTVQQTLFKNEIAAAKTRLAAIETDKVAGEEKSALQSAINTADSEYIGLSDNTTAIAFNKMRNALRTAVENAGDNSITTTAVTRSSGTVSLSLLGGSAWTDAVTAVSIENTTLDTSAYNINDGVLTIDSACFTNPVRTKDYTVKITSENFADVTQTVTVTYYGAQTFQLRYLDGKGNVIKSKSYTKDQIIALSGDTDYYYNTACSMTGLRTFKAKGVTLKALLNDAGITFGAGMTEKLRTNDSVTGDVNDPTSENAYYERSTRTYESLMQKRYYFPDLFTESALADTAKSERGVTDTLRAALGASTTKQETEPLIAYEYVEKVYSQSQASLEGDSYDLNLASDKCFRFLFGTAMDETDPTVAAKEVTTWSVAYNTFGIDIIDPNYVKPSASTSGGSSGGTTTVTSSYSVTKPADTAEGSVKLSSTSAKKGDTVTVTVTPKTGYKADKVTATDKSGNAVTVTANSNGTYSFKMPDSAVTLKVTYTKTDAETPVTQPEETQKPTEGTDTSVPFTDVTADHWSYSAIQYAYKNNLFNGTGDKTFGPTDNMTRGMLVTVLYRMAGSPAVEAQAAFGDVSSDAYYANAVAWAYKNNIVTGVDSSSFAPNNNITREQMAAILYRYSTFKAYTTAASGSLSTFTDAGAASDYAADSLAWAVGNNLVSGMGDGTVAPKGNATREQVAAILQRFCEGIAK